MYCENCGNKIDNSSKFCENCGYEVSSLEVKTETKSHDLDFDKAVWTRLVKVIYICLYLPLLVIVPVTWELNKPYCYYNYNCPTDYTESFWYSVLAFLIYMVFVRLIKVTYLYIVFAKKPRWDLEIKRVY